MSKIDIEAAYIYSNRADVRDVIRQSLKLNGLDTNNIQNVVKEPNMLSVITKSAFSYLILDWEMGADAIIRLLENNRKSSAIESHPTFLIAAQEDENIIKTAREFFVNHCIVGDITTDTIRDQIKALVAEYRRLSPIRQFLINVENAKRNGKLDQAHEMLTRLYQKSPENPRVVVELAESLVQMERWKEAEDILRPNLDLEPPYARIKHLYAKCRLRENDYNSAIASLKGAQLISPYNTERLLEMGEVFLDIDRVEEANEAYEEILKIAPSSKPAKLGKSKSMLLSGELNEALNILRECASNRELSSVFNTAAVIAIKLEKYNVGFGLYQKAIRLLAKERQLQSRIIYNMGIGFVKTGDSTKGLTCFKKSYELDPTFENANHNAKILDKQQGDSNPLDLADFQTVEFEETIVHEGERDQSHGEDKKAQVDDLDQGLIDNLDLDSIFDDVENF